jgi:hypothetical protein
MDLLGIPHICIKNTEGTEKCLQEGKIKKHTEPNHGLSDSADWRLQLEKQD